MARKSGLQPQFSDPGVIICLPSIPSPGISHISRGSGRVRELVSSQLLRRKLPRGQTWGTAVGSRVYNKEVNVY